MSGPRISAPNTPDPPRPEPLQSAPGRAVNLGRGAPGHGAAAPDAAGPSLGAVVAAGVAAASTASAADSPAVAAPRRASRGPRRSEETHRAILAAAMALIEENGPAGVTFEGVARRAGASKPTLYRWWPSRIALLLEVHDRLKAAHLVFTPVGALRPDLVAFTRALWTYWRETSGGDALRGIIAEAQTQPADAARLFDHYLDPDRSHVLPLLIAGRARGELPPSSDVVRAARALIAVNWYHLLTGQLVDAEIEPMIDLVLAGAAQVHA
jgi:AcrR family transcriptional regulator